MSRARVAVLKVISRELSVTDAAAQYGYSRQHLHRLIARYKAGGLEAVEPRSRRPGREQLDDLVHVPPCRGPAGPEARGQFVERLPLRRQASTSRASWPGSGFRHRDPVAFRCRRTAPAVKLRALDDSGSAAR